MQFKSLFVIASFVAASVSQTFSMVDNEINMKLTPAMDNFNATIHAFPILGDGTVDQAMVCTIFLVLHMSIFLIHILPLSQAIHNSAMTLNDAAKNVTNAISIMPSKFSDDEGMKILLDLQPLKDTFMAAMTGIVARLPALRTLPRGGIPPIIKNDLEEMKSYVGAFIIAFNDHASESILTFIAQPMVVKQAMALEDMGASTFSQVMEMYEYK
ncbi:hypothetical protein C0992_004183 [Termitomyces sp. T32_za158]|nr:hypothetical protein C0992_004183 [Termitomyces sp. T32_za158]